jgi:branched-chain amino acid transport system substrate-binding protein
VNRICARDDVQGPLDADFAAKDLAAKTIFIIQDKTTYGQGIADEVKAQAAVDGMTVLGYEGITAGESDFSAVLNKVAVAKPDVVFFGGMFPEGSLLIKQMNDKGIKSKFLGPDGMDDPEVINIAGNAAIGTYYSSPAADISRTPAGKAWLDKFTAEFGKAPSNWTAYGYDAMNVIMQGIKNAIVANGGKKPTRLQVSTAVRAINGFQGLTSLISFDDKGDNKGAKLYVAEFKTATYPPTVVKEVDAYK